MTTLLPARGGTPCDHVARRVARSIGGFEHTLLGRVPRSVTVVAMPDRLVVTVHEAFTPLERRLVGDAGGCCRVDDFHRDVFESSSEALLDHVRRSTGVELDAGLVHVDAATGSILKTFTTESSVELVLLGQALPTLGVPVNAHLHANGAAGIGAGRS